jgi:hypothetical protein
MTAWHVRAIRLPDGDAVEDAWLTAEGWSERPYPDAEDVPGGYARFRDSWMRTAT